MNPAELPSLICCPVPHSPPMGQCGQRSGAEGGLRNEIGGKCYPEVISFQKDVI